MGVVAELTVYCGCDGRSFSSGIVGCQSFEYAHLGPC